MNKLYLALFVALTLFIVTITSAKGESFRGIRPLVSTRTEVERILGRPDKDGFFQLKEGKVKVFYGEGLGESDTCQGIAGKDVVARISLSLDHTIRLTDKRINLVDFRKTVDSEHPELVQYTDWHKGLAYSASSRGNEIYSIFYYPSKEDCDKLLRG